MKTAVCVSMTFDTAHRLYEYDGPCSRIHGHTYRVEVAFAREGFLNNKGMVLDFKTFKQYVKEVIDTLDHRLLLQANDPLCVALSEYPEQYIGLHFIPTAENLAWHILGLVFDATERAKIFADVEVKVRLWETPTCYAEAYRAKNNE
jgi:6-pyruvoyltetrahydropterin/6-carboxytetrahydropterin synthase